MSDFDRLQELAGCQALEAVPVPVAVHDPDHRLVWANRAYREATGLALAELRGRRCWEVWGLAHLCAGCPVLETLETGRPAEAELTPWNQKDWPEAQGCWQCKAAPLFDEKGAVLGAVEVAIEITTQVLAQREVAHQIRRQQAVLDILQHEARDLQDFLDHALNQAIALTGSRIGYIYFYDEDTREFTLNSWSRDVMDECSVVNPQTVYSLDKTGIWGEVVRQRRAILVNDFPAANPLKKGVPAGHVRLERFLSIPVQHQGRIVAVVGVANKTSDYTFVDELQLTLLMDAVWKWTESLRSRDAMRRSLEEARRFRDALDHVPACVYMKDPESRYLYANRPTLELFGTTAEALVGQGDASFFPPETVALLREVDLRVLAGESTAEEIDIPDLRGERHVYWEVKTPLLGPDGVVCGLVGISADITAHKRADEDRALLRDQLAQAQRLESIGRLAGGVAHDFNNMLNVILSHAEMSMEEANVPVVRESLEQILGAARRSAALTGQLLAFARRQPVNPRALDLEAMIGRLLQMLRRLIGEELELVWNPGRERLIVAMDPSQLDQVLANLCVNARDAITGPGRITIETGLDALDEDDLAGRPGVAPGAFARLSVSDTGSRIPAEVLDRIFEPFFTTKGEGRGTGLGLATVSGIVAQNGGFVTVESALGRGTTFRVHLPLRADLTVDEEATPPPVTTPVPEPGHETVLIVEDEPEILNVATRILERRGYHVVAAPTPGVALALAEGGRLRVDLLVTDVIMPGMDGRALAGRLQALLPGLRCLFISGYTADHIARHGMLDPGIHFLQKPFSGQELVSMVRRVLDG